MLSGAQKFGGGGRECLCSGTDFWSVRSQNDVFQTFLVPYIRINISQDTINLCVIPGLTHIGNSHPFVNAWVIHASVLEMR